ncbi:MULTISPECIES: aldo/keto reductase [Thermus]|jgi:aryl-alcohol dehydrogenase-like predicted oxidoreductase|uniref:Potassium channel subunit beta n=1 Tax=Thermus brockianus TaxID=56956 RepID=A0A1J0LT99_THEBO|nr:aldo/keto reductase [Thermus brockianus]APD09550.1 potassium channel subunit beta [Thermus brockianus]
MNPLWQHPMGVGTWAWGDRLFWGYGKAYGEAELREAFRESLRAGLRLFDTAEFYGFGLSERLLGRFMAETGERPFLVTKFFPYPWRLSRKSLLKALKGSLERLGVEAVDLYLLHWPWPPVPLRVWAEALAEAHERGLARGVGVANCSVAQLEAVKGVLERHRVPLWANQVELNLLQRDWEAHLPALRREGIALMAYSPLAMGWLTGKLDPDHPPKGYRGSKYRPFLDWVRRLLPVLQGLAEAKGTSPAAIALRYLMEKGALPIPGAKNAHQAQQNAMALRISLTPEEMALLEGAS